MENYDLSYLIGDEADDIDFENETTSIDYDDNQSWGDIILGFDSGDKAKLLEITIRDPHTDQIKRINIDGNDPFLFDDEMDWDEDALDFGDAEIASPDALHFESEGGDD